jgi:uncharacterized protein
MEMDPALLDILCCPQTHQPLHPANSEEVACANAHRANAIKEGLTREDGKILYPVQNGIPLLVPEAGFPLN